MPQQCTTRNKQLSAVGLSEEHNCLEHLNYSTTTNYMLHTHQHTQIPKRLETALSIDE